MRTTRRSEGLFSRGEPRESGFTLVEVLVVFIILSLLAAIEVSLYIRQRDQAARAQVRATLYNAAIALESYAADNGGRYTGASVPVLQSQEHLRITEGVALDLPPGKLSVDAYCFEASSALLGGQVWRLRSSEREPREGPCP